MFSILENSVLHSLFELWSLAQSPSHSDFCEIRGTCCIDVDQIYIPDFVSLVSSQLRSMISFGNELFWVQLFEQESRHWHLDSIRGFRDFEKMALTKGQIEHKLVEFGMSLFDFGWSCCTILEFQCLKIFADVECHWNTHQMSLHVIWNQLTYCDRQHWRMSLELFDCHDFFLQCDLKNLFEIAAVGCNCFVMSAPIVLLEMEESNIAIRDMILTRKIQEDMLKCWLLFTRGNRQTLRAWGMQLTGHLRDDRSDHVLPSQSINLLFMLRIPMQIYQFPMLKCLCYSPFRWQDGHCEGYNTSKKHPDSVQLCQNYLSRNWSREKHGIERAELLRPLID
jgi:hypothetical protein